MWCHVTDGEGSHILSAVERTAGRDPLQDQGPQDCLHCINAGRLVHVELHLSHIRVVYHQFLAAQEGNRVFDWSAKA